MNQNELDLIEWVWNKRLTTTFNADTAISLIETIHSESEISEGYKEKIKQVWNELQEDFNKKNIGKTFICLQCKKVFRAGAMFAKCCGKEVGKNLEEFSPEKHGEDLVGLSNSWIHVDEYIEGKWSKNPIYQEVYDEIVSNGNYGSATIFISFVEELIRKIEERENP